MQVALPCRVGLFELPSLRGGEFAFVLDLFEMLRNHEPQCFGLGQIALLREAAQASAKVRGHVADRRDRRVLEGARRRGRLRRSEGQCLWCRDIDRNCQYLESSRAWLSAHAPTRTDTPAIGKRSSASRAG